MTNKKDPLKQDDFDYSKGAGRIARFKATRAILEASKQISVDSSIPKKMKPTCIMPRGTKPPKFLSEV